MAIEALHLTPARTLKTAKTFRHPGVTLSPAAEAHEGGLVRVGDQVPVMTMRGPSLFIDLMTWAEWPDSEGRPTGYAAYGGNCLIPALGVCARDIGGNSEWTFFEQPELLALAGTLHSALSVGGRTFSLPEVEWQENRPAPRVLAKGRWPAWLDSSCRVKPEIGEAALSDPMVHIWAHG